jgi:hypothetical protein
MAQVSLAWLLSKSVVSAPIVGATSLEKLTDLIGMDHVQRTIEQALIAKQGRYMSNSARRKSVSWRSHTSHKPFLVMHDTDRASVMGKLPATMNLNANVSFVTKKRG